MSFLIVNVLGVSEKQLKLISENVEGSTALLSLLIPTVNTCR